MFPNLETISQRLLATCDLMILPETLSHISVW